MRNNFQNLNEYTRMRSKLVVMFLLKIDRNFWTRRTTAVMLLIKIILVYLVFKDGVYGNVSQSSRHYLDQDNSIGFYDNFEVKTNSKWKLSLEKPANPYTTRVDKSPLKYGSLQRISIVKGIDNRPVKENTGIMTNTSGMAQRYMEIYPRWYMVNPNGTDNDIASSGSTESSGNSGGPSGNSDGGPSANYGRTSSKSDGGPSGIYGGQSGNYGDETSTSSSNSSSTSSSDTAGTVNKDDLTKVNYSLACIFCCCLCCFLIKCCICLLQAFMLDCD